MQEVRNNPNSLIFNGIVKFRIEDMKKISKLFSSTNKYFVTKSVPLMYYGIIQQYLLIEVNEQLIRLTKMETHVSMVVKQ